MTIFLFFFSLFCENYFLMHMYAVTMCETVECFHRKYLSANVRRGRGEVGVGQSQEYLFRLFIVWRSM